MVRDTLSGQWSAPAFLKANEASLGFQIDWRAAVLRRDSPGDKSGRTKCLPDYDIAVP